MKWRRILGRVVAMAAAVLLAGGTFFSTGAAVHAAPATRSTAAMPTYVTPYETSKVMLHETSNDGPALWTQRGQSAPTGPLAVLAWTGTDSRLNYVFTNDGVSVFGKTTLNETSFVRPAVLRGLGQGVTTAPVALAWTGTDAGHHLNVVYLPVSAAPMKLTLWSDTSFTSPSLEWLSGDTKTLLLAWAGMDGNHSLNVLPISITSSGLKAGTKTTLWSYHGYAQPGLIADSSMTNQARFFLSWSDLASHSVACATSPDGKTWTKQPAMDETTRSAPSMLGLNETLGGLPPYWLGWTGTDSAHHVNVLYNTDFSSWSTDYVKATLPETAVGGTVVGYIFQDKGKQMLVAWTGTDSMHHLNLAKISV